MNDLCKKSEPNVEADKDIELLDMAALEEIFGGSSDDPDTGTRTQL